MHVNSYSFQFLTPQHRLAVLSLNQHIVDDPQTTFFMEPLRKEILNFCLNESSGFGIGIFAGDSLIGYRLIYFPHTKSEVFLNFQGPQYKIDLRLPPKEINRSARFAGIAIHQDYRGKGLGNRLMAEAIEVIRQKNYQWIIVTCHPSNHPSLHLLKKFGFYPTDSIKKENGRDRILLLCELNKSARI